MWWIRNRISDVTVLLKVPLWSSEPRIFDGKDDVSPIRALASARRAWLAALRYRVTLKRPWRGGGDPIAVAGGD
ncbi:MAG: hypothetical protein CMJ88_10255 [Planctomycetes bacterium]|nr:hypothetical protein [Planctomycetota bacterium]